MPLMPWLGEAPREGDKENRNGSGLSETVDPTPTTLNTYQRKSSGLTLNTFLDIIHNASCLKFIERLPGFLDQKPRDWFEIFG